MRHRRKLTVAAVATAALGVSMPAFAFWNVTSGSSTVNVAADTLSPPATVSTTAQTTTSITLKVVAGPSSGPTPTSYRVDRTVGTSPGPANNVCTISAVGGTCNDTGLSAGKSYSYVIRSLLGTAPWVSGPSSTIATGTVAAPVAQLVFTTQPSGATSTGVNFPVQPVVKVEDGSGNVLSSATGTVTLSTNAGTGSLTGCTSGVGLSSGVATFTGCRWSQLGTGDTIKATGSLGSIAGLTATSNSFNMNSPSKLVFTTQPSSTATSGVAFGNQPVVTVEDTGNNTVTSYGSSVSMALSTLAGATLTCTSTTASYGVATFTGCSIDKASATPYTLKASTTTPSLNVTSTGVTVSAGAATQIELTMSPSGDLQTGSSATLTATIEDANGNTVTSGADAADIVTFSQSGTGSVTMTGGAPSTASAGVATKSIAGNVAGPVTLQASATLAGGATDSNELSFNVVTLTITGFTRSGGSHNASFSGSGAAGSAAVSVKVCSSNSFPTCTAVTTASTGSNPSNPWTTAITSGNPFTSGATYFAQATQSGATSAVFQFVFP